MAVNSKRKGNAFERTIANYLSDRFAEYLGKEQGFWRRSDSGSRFGGKNQARTETHLEEHQGFGDIMCPQKFRWTIECKNYGNPPGLGVILNEKCALFDDWIKQATQDAENSGREPMLIVHFSRCQTTVWTHERVVAATAKPLFRYKEFVAQKLEDFFLDDDQDYFEV